MEKSSIEIGHEKKKHRLKSLETKVMRTAKIDDKNVNQFIVTQFIVPIEF